MDYKGKEWGYECVASLSSYKNVMSGANSMEQVVWRKK
jgi:hypothetical protein